MPNPRSPWQMAEVVQKSFSCLEVRPFGKDLALETLRRKEEGGRAAIDMLLGVRLVCGLGIHPCRNAESSL